MRYVQHKRVLNTSKQTLLPYILHAWSNLHFRRSVSMLSNWECISSLSSIVPPLFVTKKFTLHTFKTFRAAFFAYRNNFFSIISSLATGYTTPQFLLPNQLATSVQELVAKEFHKSSKLTPAIPSGFEAVYYELQYVLEVTMLPKCTSFVLGIPMDS